MNEDQETTADETTLDEPTSAVTSRRSLVSKGAIAAAVGAAAGIAMKSPASAANGDIVRVGETDTGTATTTLNGGTTFRVIGGGSVGNASIYGVADGTGNSRYGVRGDYNSADADGAGVYGYHSSTSVGGTGVKGESALGTGVYGVKTDSGSGGIGVHGRTESTTAGEGVRGESNGTEGIGVRGRALGTRSTGVSGESSDGVGVAGLATFGVGVRGRGTTADLEAASAGIIRISATVATDVTPTSSGQPGSLARNSDGSLWYYFDTNKWQKITGVGTAGAFHPVTPFRVYDSRRIAGPLLSTASTDFTLSVKDARDPETYAITTTDATPVGAAAVSANIAVINTSGNGFISVNPGGDSAIGASALNWFVGARLGNAGIFRLNGNRELQIIAGGNSTFEFLVDITGYWL